MHTPSFLVWALARPCPLRQIAGWENPERTERLLRAARAWDEAVAEGRVLDGICVARGAESQREPSQVFAFRTDGALAVYGGEEQVRAACRDCPANALRRHHGRTVVGCFGMWPLPVDLDAFCRQVEQQIAAADRSLALAVSSVQETTPSWYGLWLTSPLPGPAAAAVAGLLRQLRLDDPASAAGRDELALALDVATGGIPLHFLLFPPGRVDGPSWNLVPHCGRCQAPWEGGCQCRVCGPDGQPAAAKKRHVRGQRPFVPLANLLGREEADGFLVRYRAFRRIPSCD